jgi:hypothetical protein
VEGTSGPGGMPRPGGELGRGAEGVVYENLDQPGWVVKVFHPGGTSLFQARNEFENLEKARAIRPDNVVQAQAPADPQQGWLAKERVIRETPTPADLAEGMNVEHALINGGIQDIGGNLIFGWTTTNSTPRWLLIE